MSGPQASKTNSTVCQTIIKSWQVARSGFSSRTQDIHHCVSMILVIPNVGDTDATVFPSLLPCNTERFTPSMAMTMFGIGSGPTPITTSSPEKSRVHSRPSAGTGDPRLARTGKRVLQLIAKLFSGSTTSRSANSANVGDLSLPGTPTSSPKCNLIPNYTGHCPAMVR
jgi:hypothetical protein